MTKILVFQAKKIITMNASNPYATHVAIQDGRILGAGTLDEMAMYGAYDLNDSFADKILTPGFVEGHAHAMEGGVWDQPIISPNSGGSSSKYDAQVNTGLAPILT